MEITNYKSIITPMNGSTLFHSDFKILTLMEGPAFSDFGSENRKFPCAHKGLYFEKSFRIYVIFLVFFEILFLINFSNGALFYATTKKIFCIVEE